MCNRYLRPYVVAMRPKEESRHYQHIVRCLVFERQERHKRLRSSLRLDNQYKLSQYRPTLRYCNQNAGRSLFRLESPKSQSLSCRLDSIYENGQLISDSSPTKKHTKRHNCAKEEEKRYCNQALAQSQQQFCALATLQRL